MTQQFSRRVFLAGSGVAASAGIVGVANAQPAPGGAETVSVKEALMLRRSTKRFGRGDVSREKVLEILWAANGVNRPDSDGRTAPAWHGAKNIDIYAALEDGVSLYDPVANTLEKVSDTDIRADVSPTAFVRRAPAVLIYVSDRQRLEEAAGDIATSAPEELEIAARVNSAIMAQNVYLFCAAEGIGTCLLGTVDREAIHTALEFPDHLSVTYIQPVGEIG
ncbi:nitroreductase family protein [Rhizobiaceae bacterium BDR2-2]|uniref:Nitroreductase family protein n=1 Tax=Ectorhizobium quercum TaxID=2965071 RepID=A0AAE3N0E7_9HYPH|nr:nitroreductase family protein [Ectorhizobium quercum]MCX8997424.1 nitroreductase family protein [Ectorhizobium quercum]